MRRLSLTIDLPVDFGAICVILKIKFVDSS